MTEILRASERTGACPAQTRTKQQHLVIAFCAKLPDGHLKFQCSVLHSNVDFYFKFDEYLNTALIYIYICVCVCINMHTE